MIYFEDAVIGEKYALGGITFSEDMINRFARIYGLRTERDGKLAASGWHVVAVWMQLMMAQRDQMSPRNGDDEPASGPSPGFLKLSWPHPVCAGDVIAYDGEVVEKIELRSRPNLGIVRNLNRGINQRGELVMSFIGQALFQRRNPRENK